MPVGVALARVFAERLGDRRLSEPRRVEIGIAMQDGGD